MKTRDIFIGLCLVAVTVAALGFAHRTAWRQERRAIARGSVPVVPELGLWPAELKAAIDRDAAEVRTLADPTPALGRLGRRYAANGFVGQATEVLAGLTRIDPPNPRWPYLTALVRERAGDPAGAISALEQCLELAPTAVPALLRLGELQMQTGDFDAAYRSFTRAANATSGDDFAAQFALARLQARTGLQGDPRARLNALVQRHPEIRDVHLLLARVLAAGGDTAGAAEQHRLAADAHITFGIADPTADELDLLVFDPVRLGALGARRLREGRPAEAEALLQQAIRLAPADPRFRLDLAAVFARSERPAEARAILQAAVTACPDDPELPVRLAAALRVERKAAEAASVAQQAIARWPDVAALHLQLGLAEREKGENEPAVAELRRAVELDPLDAEAQHALAVGLLALKQIAAARAAAEAAVALRPGFEAALILLGGLAIDAGDSGAAETIVQRLNELQSRDPGSRLLFAGLQLIKGDKAQESGDLDAAAKLYVAGLTVAPDFAPLLRESGLLAVRRSRFREAAGFFDHYLQVERRDLRGYVWLGDALDQCDRGEEARDVYARGLALAQKVGDRTRITELSTRLDR